MVADQHDERGWLSLGAACKVLGVNETTLRRWADEGRVRSFRTPGGHRRFAEADVRTLLQSSDTPREALGGISDVAITRIRRRLQGRQGTTAPWNQEMDEDVRMRMRALGRRLMTLIDNHLSGRTRRIRLMEEARDLGIEYGRELAAGRLPLSSTIEAFTFFRRSLEETVSGIAAKHNLTPESAAEAHEHIARVVDTVLVALTRAYEERQMASGRWTI